MGLLEEQSISGVEVVAYEGLRAEALRRLGVEDFPVTVVDDIYGGDLHLFHLALWDLDGEVTSCIAFQRCLQQFHFHGFAEDCVEM